MSCHSPLGSRFTKKNTTQHAPVDADDVAVVDRGRGDVLVLREGEQRVHAARLLYAFGFRVEGLEFTVDN